MGGKYMRTEGSGRIGWYVGDSLIREVTTEAYYRDARFHPAHCECAALVHDAAFQTALTRDVEAALAAAAREAG